MKKIAITGTTHGIGKAISEKFEKEGWEVIHLDRNICNVSYMSDIELLELPKIDAFINNAGIMPLIDFEQDDLRNWNNVVNTNLRGPFFLSQKAVKALNDGGHLINISSVCGINPDKEFMLYSLTKAALINFTYALSKRYGNRIFVNCISPGFVESNLCGNDPVPPHLIEDIPMKRQAKPEEVAELVWNMINYKYLNGSNIVFDGGISAKHMGGY